MDLWLMDWTEGRIFRQGYRGNWDKRGRKTGWEGKEKGRMRKLRIERKDGEYGKEKLRGWEYVERSM